MEQLASNLVNSDDGILVSPLIKTNWKGGAFAIIILYNGAACFIGAGVALHKLGLIHYVLRMVDEAWHAANVNNSRNLWHPEGRVCWGSWFSEHISGGYQA